MATFRAPAAQAAYIMKALQGTVEKTDKIVR